MFLESTKKFEERLRKALGSMASDVMTEDPITIAPDATVAEAAREIARHKHNRLPVVEHGRLIGRRHPHRRPRRADGRVDAGREARIDAGAIERNCARLAALAPLCAVVKADGYGHGAVEAARAAQRGGAVVARGGDGGRGGGAARRRGSTARCW